jgi:hypothetical protein
MRRPMAGAAAIAIALLSTAGAIGDLEKKGMDEVAPSEMQLARDLEKAGKDRLLGLQIELLETMAGAKELEDRAAEAELAALEAEREVRVEQAAYEFVAEQILSSGVASYWSTP